MAAPNHKVAVDREVAVLLPYLTCLPMYSVFDRSSVEVKREKSAESRIIYIFQIRNLCMTFPSSKIESFLIVESGAHYRFKPQTDLGAKSLPNSINTESTGVL